MKSTKVLEFTSPNHHLTKSRHTFSRLIHTFVKRLGSMHVLLLLQNLIELFNESTVKNNHKEYLIEIKSSIVSVDHNGY
jgi:hypothetical protein